MTDKKNIKIDGKPVSARELTVREVDAVMESFSSGKMHPLEIIHPEARVPAVAVALSIGDRLKDPANTTELENRLDLLKDLLPSEIPELFSLVEEKNPSLVQAVMSLAEVAERFEEAKAAENPRKNPSTTSADQSAD